jgi:hypothetical protein
MEHENLNTEETANSDLGAVSGWVRCSDCKYLRHEVRLGNPYGDIVECMQDSNENTFINDRNIYEKWHCDVFEPCR